MELILADLEREKYGRHQIMTDSDASYGRRDVISISRNVRVWRFESPSKPQQNDTIETYHDVRQQHGQQRRSVKPQPQTASWNQSTSNTLHIKKAIVTRDPRKYLNT